MSNDARSALVERENTMHPTPYPELNAVLSQMVTGTRATLADTFVGA